MRREERMCRSDAKSRAKDSTCRSVARCQLTTCCIIVGEDMLTSHIPIRWNTLAIVDNAGFLLYLSFNFVEQFHSYGYNLRTFNARRHLCSPMEQLIWVLPLSVKAGIQMRDVFHGGNLDHFGLNASFPCPPSTSGTK